MATRRYISRINIHDYSGNIQIAIFDPNRWPDATPKGGAKFGFEASLYGGRRLGDDEMEWGVQLGGIGAHSADDAEERIDVYQQGADLVRFLNDMFAQGVKASVLEAYLNQQLGGGKPTTGRFVYRSGDRDKLLGILALVGDAWVAEDVA